MACESHSVMSDSLQPQELYSPWNSSGQNTGVGSYSLLQGIFPTQGSNPGLPHCRQILYQLSHQGSPRILEWVAYPFSSRSSRPKNQTRVSCVAGGFFISWATREDISLKAVLTAIPVDCVEHLRVSTHTDWESWILSLYFHRLYDLILKSWILQSFWFLLGF